MVSHSFKAKGITTTLSTASLVLTILAAPAFADQNNNAESHFHPHWKGSVSSTFSGNYDADDRQVDFNFNVGYQFNPEFSVSMSSGVTYQKDRFCSTHTDDYWCIASTSVTASYSNLYKWKDNATFGLKGRLLLPTSDYLKDTKLRFGIGAYLPVSFNVGKYIEGLSLSIQPAVTKYFNKYETAGGRNLTEYKYQIGVSGSYAITDKVSISANVTDSHYTTYKGDSLHPSVSHSEELGYAATDHLYVGIGYENNAQYYNPEKGSNPISGLFDDKDPHYYITSSYQF